jgi:hypothetical protein
MAFMRYREPHKVPLNISWAAVSWTDPRNGLPAKYLGLTLGSCFKIIACFKDICLNSFIFGSHNQKLRYSIVRVYAEARRIPVAKFTIPNVVFWGACFLWTFPCHRVIKNPIGSYLPVSQSFPFEKQTFCILVVRKKLTVNLLTMIRELIPLKLAFVLSLSRVEPAAETTQRKH